MIESKQPEYEPTPDALRERLEELGLKYLAYTGASVSSNNAVSLALNTVNGERVIISKAQHNSQPIGNFFQDLLMTVHPAGNATFPYDNLDFNFNQMGDGMLRRRAIKRTPNELMVGTQSSFDLGTFEEKANHLLFDARQMQANYSLEVAMGANNQPATAEEVREAFGYLKGAVVLDVNNGYEPIEVIS